MFLIFVLVVVSNSVHRVFLLIRLRLFGSCPNNLVVVCSIFQLVLVFLVFRIIVFFPCWRLLVLGWFRVIFNYLVMFNCIYIIMFSVPPLEDSALSSLIRFFVSCGLFLLHSVRRKSPCSLLNILQGSSIRRSVDLWIFESPSRCVVQVPKLPVILILSLPTTSDGLIFHLFGPETGRLHDLTVYRQIRMDNVLEQSLLI